MLFPFGITRSGVRNIGRFYVSACHDVASISSKYTINVSVLRMRTLWDSSNTGSVVRLIGE